MANFADICLVRASLWLHRTIQIKGHWDYVPLCQHFIWNRTNHKLSKKLANHKTPTRHTCMSLWLCGNVAPSNGCKKDIHLLHGRSLSKLKKLCNCLLSKYGQRNLTKKELNHDACQRQLACYYYFVHIMITTDPPASNSVYGRENCFDMTKLIFQIMCVTVVQ